MSKRAWLGAVVFGSVTTAAALAACGGNVVFVEDGGEGGSGASGPTTSGPTTSGPTTSGPTTSGPATSVTNVTSGPSVSVSTGSGSFCDTGEPSTIDSGECQNCVQCAQGDPCSAVINDCFADPECSSFVDCLNNCGGPDCGNECQMQFPGGVQGYLDILNCLVCDACPNNCDAASNCPF
jgi:hypothetical protein